MATAPVKRHSYVKENTFRPTQSSQIMGNLLKSFRNTSVSSGSVMRTNSYARFMQKNSTSSLYEKTYGFSNSPSRHSRIIKNKPMKRRSLEVSRCSTLEQREQYRRLIEQYRTKSLKETEQLFKLGKKPEPSKTGDKINSTIIDLTGRNSPENDTKNAVVFKEKSQHLENITKKIKLATQQAETKENGQADECITSPKKHVSEFKIPEGFSSPYLSENFIPDLIKSYGRRERQRQAQKLSEETRARLLREKREAKEALLSEILQEKLKLKDKKIEEIEIPKLPEITCEMNDTINNALVPYPPQQVISEGFNIQITRDHMSTLFGLNWLNDEIINFYMELIVDRSKERDDLPTVHTMNTFFYPRLSSQSYSSVRRWTRRVDIFSKDLILYPIHLGVHWCLAVTDFLKKEIRYYDSMGGANQQCLVTLKNYLHSEHENKKGSPIDLSEWKLLSMTDIPQQMNGSDCGVFSCKFAEYICANSEITFEQRDMPYFRRAMVWEILNKKLLR